MLIHTNSYCIHIVDFIILWYHIDSSIVFFKNLVGESVAWLHNFYNFHWTDFLKTSAKNLGVKKLGTIFNLGEKKKGIEFVPNFVTPKFFALKCIPVFL